MSASVTMADLIKLDGAVLEEGDFVYEPVRFGPHDEHVKFNEFKVLQVERGACSVVRTEGKHRPIKISFGRLLMKRPVPATSTPPLKHHMVVVAAAPATRTARPAEPAPAPRKSASEDQLGAWLSMGSEVLDSLSIELATLSAQAERIQSDIEEIDATHRKIIEALERDLEKAREAHASDRALAESRREQLAQQCEQLGTRKRVLEKMLGGANGHG